MILYLLALKYELSSQFQPKRPYCVGLDEKNSVQLLRNHLCSYLNRNKMYNIKE